MFDINMALKIVEYLNDGVDVYLDDLKDMPEKYYYSLGVMSSPFTVEANQYWFDILYNGESLISSENFVIDSDSELSEESQVIDTIKHELYINRVVVNSAWYVCKNAVEQENKILDKLKAQAKGVGHDERTDSQAGE